jgi:hypothetical protein
LNPLRAIEFITLRRNKEKKKKMKKQKTVQKSDDGYAYGRNGDHQR